MQSKSRVRTRRRFGRGALTVALALTTLLVAAPAGGQEGPKVRAVLFFSPTCGHCEYVINEVLPGIFTENGGTATLYWDSAIPESSLTFFLASNGTLEILLVDVTQVAGGALFQSATEAFDIDSTGVPRLVVGDRYLIGSGDIPEIFPGLIADALATGTGIDWPAIPGLEDALAATGTEPTTTTTAPAVTTTLGPDVVTTTTTSGGVLPLSGDKGPWERFRQDPAGNTLAVMVLALMVATAIGTVFRLSRPTPLRPVGLHVPLLALIGLAIAAYLTYVEVADRTAVCGPVGDCNTVQQSDYAELFGIPIGVIGIVGYLLILGLWVGARLAPRRTDWLTLAGFGIVAGGVLFSLYLTILEPFVIGASCAWCLGSALTISALLWVSGPPARSAWRRLHIRPL